MNDSSPFALLLSELESYRGKIVVLKIGGNSIDEDPAFLPSVAKQAAFLRRNGVRPVIVHGGGPQIDRALQQSGLSRAKAPDGRRTTSPEMMQVVTRVMDEISEAVAQAIEAEDVPVFAAARSHVCFVKAQPLLAGQGGPETDRTGRPASVDHEALSSIALAGQIAVLGSLGCDADGNDYNINADDTAMDIAIALQAKRLLLATNVRGVLDHDKNLLSRLNEAEALRLIGCGVISGGMIPKVQSALQALKSGVGGVAIVNAHERGSLLAELLSPAGSGTLITEQ